MSAPREVWEPREIWLLWHWSDDDSCYSFSTQTELMKFVESYGDRDKNYSVRQYTGTGFDGPFSHSVCFVDNEWKFMWNFRAK